MISPSNDPRGIESTSIGKLTLKITAMESFLNMHATSEQTLKVINFIKEQQLLMTTSSERKLFKHVESARGMML